MAPFALKIVAPDPESTAGLYEVGESAAPLRPMDETAVRNALAAAIDDAVNFAESELSGPRRRADRYYRGETDIPFEPGRSRVVVSKVRDGVQAVLPSLARIFTQSDTIAEFVSDDEEDAKFVSEATAFCNGVFHKNGGYTALIQGCTDALKARIGTIKVSLVEAPVPRHLELVPGEPVPDGTAVTETSAETVVVTQSPIRRMWKLEAVPPEEFIVSPDASCAADARLLAHRRNVPIYEAVAMGYPYERLKDLSADEDGMADIEDMERRGYARSGRDATVPGDPTARLVLLTECYFRIDADGDGIAELRRIVAGGGRYEILSDEPVNYAPYAVFRDDLQPHVFHPICLAEDLIQDQDVQTALLRAIVDNTALTNSPRTVANEQMVNLEDLKNGRIGAIVRVRAMGQVEELATPFVAGQTLPVLQYLQDVSEQRSGITKLSQGLDPDSLQSTARMAVNAAISASDARIEMRARNLAETGLSELFLCILRTARDRLRGPIQLKTPTGGYTSVNPQWWHDLVGVRVNVGLGSGRIDEKKQALAGILPIQREILQALGPANPLSSWENVRETLKTLLRLSGIHDIGNYFPSVPPQVVGEIDRQMKQAAAAQQSGGEGAAAAAALVKAEEIKAQAKIQVDGARLQSERQIEAVEMQAEREKALLEARMKYLSEVAGLRAEIAALKAKLDLERQKMLLEDDRLRDKQAQDFAAEAARVQMDAQTKRAVAAETARTRGGEERTQ
jgi:hypothetical protein